jgi:hypothetical protein
MVQMSTMRSSIRKRMNSGASMVSSIALFRDLTRGCGLGGEDVKRDRETAAAGRI